MPLDRETLGADYDKRLVASVLWKINRARVAAGLEPLDDIPQGIKGSPRSCPIARALNFSIGVDPVNLVVYDWWKMDVAEKNRVRRLMRALRGDTAQFESYFTTPEWMSVFIHRFDSGYLPQYVHEEKS